MFGPTVSKVSVCCVGEVTGNAEQLPTGQTRSRETVPMLAGLHGAISLDNPPGSTDNPIVSV